MKNKPSLSPLYIEDFTLGANTITIQWHTTTMQQNEETEVCRNCFEQWLAVTHRLDWVRDATDDYGEHQQQSGTMATDNYWQYATLEEKTDDLKAFVLAEVKAQEELS